MSTAIRFLLLILLASAIGCAGEARSEEKQPSGKALADALVDVKGDEASWFRGAALLAYSLEMGIPEDRFRETHPGARLDTLPAPVLSTLRQETRGIPAWIGCFDDERTTGILENDLFGRGSSKNAKKMTCGDAAAVIVTSLLPASALREQAQDKPPSKELLAKVASQWEAHVRAITPAERMKTWFDGANDHQRRLFLAITIQMRHAPAYPLLEANFLERAKAADAFLYLELSAYFRHRRSGGNKLFDKLEPELRKQPRNRGSSDDREFYFSMWKLLTDYDTLESAVNDWLAGRLELTKLDELLVRSIDQPWAYHSMGIEPASVFRPTMEQNLKTLVAAAARENDPKNRLALLAMGSSAANTLTSILGHTDSLDKLPAPRSDAAEWQSMVKQLRDVFHDKRVSFDGRSLTSPADKAAGIIWELWEPEEQEYDAARELYLDDWRLQSFTKYDSSCRSLLVSSAEDFLSQPEGVKLQTYPEQEGAALVNQFIDGDAAAWRKKLEPLRWNQRLLMQAEATKDQKFAARLWPRLIEFVDWTGATPGQPASFAALWRDKMVGHKLDDTTWRALQDWLVSEARAGRYWSIVGESYPVWPGISLYVLPTSSRADEADAHPILDGYINFGIGFSAKGESFRIAADGLQEFVLERDELGKDWPPPMAAIKKQNAKTEDDRDLCDRGFTLLMIVFPPMK